MANNSSEAITRGIRVEARSLYVPERSSARDDYYFFAYRVRISNLGEEAARLVAREWVITDGNGQVQRVVGPGVVGEQPLLTPGASFEYTSYCPLPTPVGSMEGAYRMVSAAGETFDASIAPFGLAVPTAVN
ncbi:MAG TPA: Co2+/Mg2+ efflux protein ApaG [Thermoanaerobaculia bacterium]|nr:Co2+/Mg2+ efflux protein ApaG [Thermoanaerobaculia bacterium]